MMGELNFFLGLQIKQLKEGTFINQAKYIRDLLKRFNMEEAKTMKTPMSSSIKLDKDEKGKFIDSTMYKGMISSLLYLTASRLDIMYSVCLCARFQSCPKESHLRQEEDYKTRKCTKIEVLTALTARPLDLGRVLLCPCASTNFSSISTRLGLLIGREMATSKAQGKCPAEPSQPNQTEVHRKARLSPKSICPIFDIPLVGLRVYESKAWPTVHRDEVSYLEAFLIDSILTGRWIHVGYLMTMHMISCCESKTRVLPYGRFLTRVFKDARVDLSERQTSRPLAFMILMMSSPWADGPSFIELLYTEIPSEAPHALDHAPWMDLSTQINSLGTRMEELTIVSDTQIYSMEDHMDQYQIGFTSQFEHLQHRFERIEEHMDQ
ncbi:hypothetical protein AAG906_003121 [Vitis piasezkii]